MKQKRKITISILLFIGIIVYIFLYRHINRQFPEPIIQTFEKASYNELLDGINICVDGREWMDKDDVVLNYGNCEILEENYKTVFVEVSFQNDSESKQEVYPYNLYIETMGLCTGLSPEIFQRCNHMSSLSFSLEAHEKRTLMLPYTIFQMNCNQDFWSSITSQSFSLAYYVYPYKKCWEF